MKKLFIPAILALVFLAACGSSGAPTEYNDTVRDNYIEGCIEDLPANEIESAASVCRCAYREISDTNNGITFTQFENLNKSLLEDINRLSDEDSNDPIVSRVQDILRDCIQDCSRSSQPAQCLPYVENIEA